MKLLYGLLGIITLLPSLSPLPARAETPPPIIFSEINWAGSEASTADEWLELANLGTEPIDLAGWAIIGGAGASNPLPLPANSSIPAFGILLLANYPLGDLKTTLNVPPNVVTTAVSLANSGLNLSLVSPNGTVTDVFVTGSKPTVGSTIPYASAERDLLTLEWKTASSTINLTKPTQFGTPGISSVPVPPPIAASEPEPPVIGGGSETTLTGGAGVPALETTPQPPPSEGGGASEPIQFTPEPPTDEPAAEIAPAIEPTVELISILEPTPAVIEPIVIAEPVVVEVVENAETTSPTQTSDTTTDSPVAPSLEEVEMLRSYPVESVIINEFVSDPADGTEWIEILNTTDEVVELTGWTERDATTTRTTFPAQTLDPHSYFVLQNPKSKLNNDGDSIFLLDATGKTIDALSYDKTSAPKKGKSLARKTNGNWEEASPTPLTMNTWAETWLGPNNDPYETTDDTTTTALNPQTNSGQTAGTDDTSRTAPAIRLERESQVAASVDGASAPLPPPNPLLRKEGEKANQPKPTIPVIDAAEITNYEANTTVIVEGVLVAGPGTFGKQLAYVDGLEVYFNKADWPKLQPMTRVRITGTVDVKTDYTRLKIKKRSDIKVIGDDSVAPDSLETLDDAHHGLLMSLTGSVADVTGKIATIDLENGETINATSAKDASVDFSDLAFGDRVAITGITRLNKGAWTFTILSQEGLTRLQEGSTASTVKATTDAPLAPSLKEGEALHSNTTIKPPTKPVPWVGGGLLTTTVGAIGYWFAKAKGLNLPSFS